MLGWGAGDACGGCGGIGEVGDLGICTDVVGTIWLTLRAPVFVVDMEASEDPKPGARAVLDVGAGGFGADVPAAVAPPNSNTAGRAGAGTTTAPRFIFISTASPGLDSVKLIFFSADLNTVSSWSIIGAGSTAGFGGAGGVGIGALVLALVIGCIAGCFDQPMSERVVGLGVDGAILLSVISCFGEASMSWRIFGADPIEISPNLLNGE